MQSFFALCLAPFIFLLRETCGYVAVSYTHLDVYKRQNQNRLANARAAEQADFAALGIGGDEIDDLDAGLQNLGGGFLLLVAGGLAMDGPALHAFGRGLFVDGLAQQVKDCLLYTSRCV